MRSECGADLVFQQSVGLNAMAGVWKAAQVLVGTDAA